MPNSAWLVQKSAKTGKMEVLLAQSWFQIEAMDKAIEGILDTRPATDADEDGYLQEPPSVTQAKREWVAAHRRMKDAYQTPE